MQYNTYERSKLYKKDRVKLEYFGDKIPHVIVSSGQRLKNKVLYEIVNEDIE